MSDSKRTNLSLPEVFARLFSSAPIVNLPEGPHGSEGRKTTSVRFPHDVHQWVHSQADHMGISVQAFVATTMKGVMHSTISPETTELDVMLMRFFMLFRMHDIGTADIPKFLLPGSLNRSDLRYPDRILDGLHDEQITHLESIFGVTSGWLNGQSDSIYTKRSFYRSMPSILEELTRHTLITGKPFKVIFLTEDGVELQELRQNRFNLDSRDSLYVHVVVALTKSINGVEVTTFQVWDSLRWDYEPTRLHAKALIYFCDKAQSSYISGRSFENDVLSSIVSGYEFVPKLTGFKHHWTLDELVWENERNPELDELASVERFFDKNGGRDYLNALNPLYEIENREEFLSGLGEPRVRKRIKEPG